MNLRDQQRVHLSREGSNWWVWSVWPPPQVSWQPIETKCSRGEEKCPKQLLILKGTLTLTTVLSSTSAWTESLPESRVASSDLSTTRSPSSVMLPRTSQSGQSCLSFSSTRCFISSNGILKFCQFSLLLNQLLSFCKPTWLNIDLQQGLLRLPGGRGAVQEEEEVNRLRHLESSFWGNFFVANVESDKNYYLAIELISPPCNHAST